MVTSDLEALPSKAHLLSSAQNGGALVDVDSDHDGVVSFHVDVPVSLKLAMKDFIEKYPNWDQYRLVQAALAGFLVQNGVDSRAITRLYVGNMFQLKALIQ